MVTVGEEPGVEPGHLPVSPISATHHLTMPRSLAFSKEINYTNPSGEPCRVF